MESSKAKNWVRRDKLEGVITTRWLGRTIYTYPIIGSTNDHLRKLAVLGEAGGTIVISDYQIGGRGRHSRQWVAPPGTSLLISLLFRPAWPEVNMAWITMIGGLAATRAINELTGLKTSLKWPNDLVVRTNQIWNKFGGLLLDGQISQDSTWSAVLGMGINVNQSEAQLPDTQPPAMSLKLLLGHEINRFVLLNRILVNIESLCDQVDSGQTPLKEWNDNLITLNQEVRVTGVQVAGTGGNEAIRGIAEGTDEYGRLLVRDSFNILHKISAGDVTLSS